MPVIGFLAAAHSLPRSRTVCAHFAEGLKETGYVEGQNVRDRISLGGGAYRSAAGAGGRSGSPAGRRDRRDRYCSGAASQGGRRLRQTIPIVFHRQRYPVADGACRQPRSAGRQRDGINLFIAGSLAAKRLELLRELVPRRRRAWPCWSIPTMPLSIARTLRDVEAAARAMGCNSRCSTASTRPRSMRPSHASARAAGALFVAADPFYFGQTRSNGRAGGAPCVASDLSGARIRRQPAG